VSHLKQRQKPVFCSHSKEGHQTLETALPWNTLSLDFWPPELWENDSCHLSHAVYDDPLWSHRKWIPGPTHICWHIQKNLFSHRIFKKLTFHERTERGFHSPFYAPLSCFYMCIFFTMYMCYSFFFWDHISLCTPGWPRTHNPPASAFWVLGLQVWTTMLGFMCYFTFFFFKSVVKVK
jgi:hypothetical protein